MKRLAPVVALVACAPFAALASSFAGTSAGTSAGGTSASSGSTSGDDKVVVRARDDAAAFVASDGQIRGVRLEAALESLRHNCARHAVGDLELAQAILVQ